MEAFVFSLAYPPNPYQDERRAYSKRALQGFGCFTGKEAAHSVSRDVTGFPSNGSNPAGRITVTCQDCHGMAAGLATSNQIINEVRFPVPQDTTQLRGLFRRIADRFDLAREGDYSIEVDPRTLTAGAMEALRDIGFNRVSFGVQDFNPAVQAAVNRVQSRDDTLAAIAAARDCAEMAK